MILSKWMVFPREITKYLSQITRKSNNISLDCITTPHSLVTWVNKGPLHWSKECIGGKTWHKKSKSMSKHVQPAVQTNIQTKPLPD
jgi:hypothetical protein